jgi:hypothetical protein
MDLDVEIKFRLGEHSFSIDVTKNQLDMLKILYKSLLKISNMQYANSLNYQNVVNSLDTTRDAIGRSTSPMPVMESFCSLYEQVLNIRTAATEKYLLSDFSAAFEKYLGIQKN